MTISNNLYKLLSPSKWRGRLEPEAAIQHEFVNHLRKLTIEGKLNAVWCSIPNEFSGTQSKVFGGKLKALGKVSGAPDLAFFWENGSGFIEFKSPKGALNTNQKLFKEWCEDNNVRYRIARNFMQAYQALYEWELVPNHSIKSNTEIYKKEEG